MMNLKSVAEIKLMQQGGEKLHQVVNQLKKEIKPGMSTKEIDKRAEELIKKKGGEPSFKKVPNYHWSTCICLNDQVVHTPPSDRKIMAGDYVTIDIGMYYQGFHTDYAESFLLDEEGCSCLDDFLQVGKQALYKAINQVKVGNRLGKVSLAIEKEIYGHGYFVLKELTGHGVGRQLHEDPFIPGYLDRPIYQTPLIKPGLVVAIEVIYSQTTEAIAYERGNQWSIVTEDGSLAACFEHTVAVTEKKSFILT
jgi:methionyl aminopeptidase